MSGERLLLDSTFVAGLINSRDQPHSKAKSFLPLVETAAEVVITEAVLIEVGNLLHAVQHRLRAAEFIDACYRTTNITVVSGAPKCFVKLSPFIVFIRAKFGG